jgi:uracil-DNA glycosylase
MSTAGFGLRGLWLRSRDSSWSALDREFSKSYMQRLDVFLNSRVSGPGICPSRRDIFKAFKLTQLDRVRVVIVGHDPYTDGRATGLAFAVPNNGSTRGSLSAISREILADTGQARVAHNQLVEWARQNVLLLNVVLTARPTAPRAFSHGRAWEKFTDRAIELVSGRNDPKVVFGLWGEQTWPKAQLINCRRHFVLPPAGHPAARPNARLPFSGCRHFSQANRLLKAQDLPEINW